MYIRWEKSRNEEKILHAARCILILMLAAAGCGSGMNASGESAGSQASNTEAGNTGTAAETTAAKEAEAKEEQSRARQSAGSFGKAHLDKQEKRG
ncbi:hypothetical protein [Cohnella pontilimi]|nr:hypothetical protein [Cohnella pontilimi]